LRPTFFPEFSTRKLGKKVGHKVLNLINNQTIHLTDLAVEIGRPKSPFASAKRSWLFKGKGGHCLSQTGLASLAAALKRRV
jgi:hypothetical protein